MGTWDNDNYSISTIACFYFYTELIFFLLSHTILPSTKILKPSTSSSLPSQALYDEDYHIEKVYDYDNITSEDLEHNVNQDIAQDLKEHEEEPSRSDISHEFEVTTSTLIPSVYHTVLRYYTIVNILVQFPLFVFFYILDNGTIKLIYDEILRDTK